MIRVVVFDFDGTLADTNAIKSTCLQRTVADLPGGPAALAAAQKIGGDRYKLFPEIVRRVSPGADGAAADTQVRTLIDKYSRCCSKGIVSATERRGARQAIIALRARGLRLWILSATPDAHLREVLFRRGIVHHLNGALGSSISKEKGLLKIMAHERVPRSAMLMVGDGPDDQRAARATGVKFVAVMAEQRIFEKGRFGMRDLRPLVPLIDQMRTKRIPI